MRIQSATHESIELLAERVLARNRVWAPPVNVDEVANAEGLDFQLVDLHDLSGGYVRDENGRGHAMIAASEHRLRQRFTKGHELAHHLVDHPERLEALGFPYLRLPTGYRGRERHWAHERFAAALLMPRGWVASFMRDRGWQLERDRLVIEAARVFDVSRAAAEIRLRELGHIAVFLLLWIAHELREDHANHILEDLDRIF
jgi:Zn-dependent peptidase ImmA (M78 family)